MKLSETVSSGWLKVPDLPPAEDGHLILTIKAAKMDTFDDGKPTLNLEFLEHEKQLGCNVTNRKRLMAMLGDIDVMMLPGCLIKVGKEWTQDMAGNPIQGVRIQAAKVPTASPPPPAAPAAFAEEPDPDAIHHRIQASEQLEAERVLGSQSADTSAKPFGEPADRFDDEDPGF